MKKIIITFLLISFTVFAISEIRIERQEEPRQSIFKEEVKENKSILDNLSAINACHICGGCAKVRYSPSFVCSIRIECVDCRYWVAGDDLNIIDLWNSLKSGGAIWDYF